MTIAPLLLLAPLLAGSSPLSPATVDELPLLDHATLARALHAVADAHPDRVTALSLGHSREGRRIEALCITGADPTPARPAILVVANLDASRLFSTSVAMHHARALAEGYGSDARVTALLDTATVYIVPRANPDGAEQYFATPRYDGLVGGRGMDTDRDGREGEDPSADVNGDGRITWIRVRDPEGKWIPDPADPRVMIEADRDKGQRGEWKVCREGADLDGDGEVAEDGPHDTVLNRNFPAGWVDQAPDAGLFHGVEPEARALMDFVVTHRDLALVVTYDSLDGLAKAQQSVDDDDGGIHDVPKAGVFASDAKLLAKIGETYREVTGSEVTGEESDAGSFQRWCYQHRGLWALNAVLWDIPLDAPKEAAEKETAEETADEEVEAPTPSDDARRLAWAEASGEGWRFVPWTAMEHPALGAVEVGGFAPFARTVPPGAAGPEIAAGQLAFLLGLGERLPRLEVTRFTRTDLGGGVWKVEAVLENHAPLPLQSHAARRARVIRPARVRLELPSSKRLLSGRLQNLLSDLPGIDGRQEYTWLVHSPGDEEFVLTVDTDNAGVSRAIAEVGQ